MATGSEDSDDAPKDRDGDIDAHEPAPSPPKPDRSRRGGLGALRSLDPRARLRLAAFGGGVLALVVTFAACGGCGRSPKTATGADATTKASASGDAPLAPAGDRAGDTPAFETALWKSAAEGEVEDLSTLAVHEGAAGLVEAATVGSPRRTTAIRAMGYARGWAQLPFLTNVASGKDEGEARLALDAVNELAARPRVAEDVEDADELREGCEALLSIAKDAARARGRRTLVVRALRMLPCPKSELPADVDAK